MTIPTAYAVQPILNPISTNSSVPTAYWNASLLLLWSVVTYLTLISQRAQDWVDVFDRLCSALSIIGWELCV